MCNLSKAFDTPTSNTKQNSTTPNENSLLSLLFRDLPIPSNNQGSIIGFLTAVSLIASTKKLLKFFMQIYINIIKNQVQAFILLALVKLIKQLPKARFPELYFGKLHLDCYRFCLQYKDHFDTTRIINNN